MDSPKYNDSDTTGKVLSDLQHVTKTIELAVDPKLMSILTILVYYVLQIPVLLFGMGSNILVMLTFIRCGLTDSVTVSFFALSISDFGYSTLFFVVRLSSMLKRIIKQPLFIRLDLLAYVVSYYSLFFNDVSVLITVFTAVQKCCCVAIPHLFKNVFTPKRATVVVIVINSSLLCLYIPLNQTLRLKPTFFASTNKTFVYLHVLPLFQRIEPVWQVISRIVLPMSAQGIVLACLFIMSFKLKQSAQFRTMSSNQQEANDSTKKADSRRLGPKETQALRAVTVVSALFIIATLPATIMYYFHLIYPILLQPHFLNIRSLVLNSQNILIHANAAVNLFVYLRFNTKFRENFNGLWVIIALGKKTEQQ